MPAPPARMIPFMVGKFLSFAKILMGRAEKSLQKGSFCAFFRKNILIFIIIQLIISYSCMFVNTFADLMERFGISSRFLQKKRVA